VNENINYLLHCPIGYIYLTFKSLLPLPFVIVLPFPSVAHLSTTCFWCFSCADVRPDPPLNITVKQQREGLLIAWLPPKDSIAPIRSYVIQYRTVGQWVELTMEKADRTWYEWKTASRGATYHFRVVSWSGHAYSDPSPTLTFYTGGTVCTAQPASITLVTMMTMMTMTMTMMMMMMTTTTTMTITRMTMILAHILTAHYKPLQILLLSHQNNTSHHIGSKNISQTKACSIV